MKKILLIDDNHHSINEGAPLFKMEKKFLVDSGFDVYSISFGKTTRDIIPNKDFVLEYGENILVKKYVKFYGSKSLEKKIISIIEKIGPGVIHNHLISTTPIPVFKALQNFNIPIIQTLHGPNFFCPTSWGNLKKNSNTCDLGFSSKCVNESCISSWQAVLIKNLFIQFPDLLKQIRVFHCPSLNIEKVANKFGYKNTVHIPLGLRKEFENVEPKKEFNNNKILFIGSLHPVKGLDVLINAVEIIVGSGLNIELLVAGKGSYDYYFKKIVSEKKLENNVSFLGYVDSSDIIELYKSVSITIVPSIWSEQFGMVGPESLACGVPVIGSNVGGIPEWLNDNEHGYLVPPRDEKDLANKISSLIVNKELLKKFGSNGYISINKYHTYSEYKVNLLNLINSFYE